METRVCVRIIWGHVSLAQRGVLQYMGKVQKPRVPILENKIFLHAFAPTLAPVR